MSERDHDQDASEIGYILAAAEAGNRLAGHEVSDFDRRLAARQLAGEITSDEAVKLSLEMVQSNEPNGDDK